ncbi:MAG: hypothetical protein FJX31_02335 [Alphaproteobacteria bacterium]|nr:hypothetical protein [Alphaproteobacteria bacterium]
MNLAWKALLLAAGCLVLLACAPPPPADDGPAPEPGRPVAQCPVIDSRGWTSWIDAMPGLDAVLTLHISGEVDLPTPGYLVELVHGPADRMIPPGQRFSLVDRASPRMAVQAVTPTPVKYAGKATYPAYREIVIGCGGRVLARIDRVEVAQ